MRLRTLGGSAAFALSLTLTGAVEAAPTLRNQMDVNGDFALIGGTFGYECSDGTPAPIVGSTKCRPVLLESLLTGNGYAYTNQSDTAPDLFWGVVDGAPRADKNVAEGESRSTAVLMLPSGATVKLARLYWAGGVANATAADKVVQLRVPGATAAKAITALDADTKTAEPGGGSDTKWYQASADVTADVSAAGGGAYTLSDVDTRNFRGRDDETVFSGWSLVVFYDLPGQPKRNLALFDGFDVVVPGSNAAADLEGFQVPKVGFDAKLGVVAYEGDNQISGDSFSVNGTVITNPLNPTNNFFNGTRSRLGEGDHRSGDLPELSGGPQSMGGIDIDVIDITGRLKPNDTKASFVATTTQDRYVLGAFVTSIATYEADFTTSAFKTAKDTNGGSLQQGDLIEYTLEFTNKGNDDAVDSVITDTFDGRLTFDTAAGVTCTDKTGTTKLSAAADEDAAEYVDGTKTLTIRVGTGANKTKGGIIKVGESVKCVFQAKLNDGATGTVPNQAKLTAGSPTGQGSAEYETDGDPATPGNQGTTTPIGECGTGVTCASPTPVCDPATTKCVGCLTGADCPAAAPVCDPTTKTCGGCSTNTDCSGATPVCNTTTRICVGCQAASDCSGATPICDPATNICVGCTTATDCPAADPVCDTAGTKTCVECVANSDCKDPKEPVCNGATRDCTGCTADADCAAPTPRCNQSSGMCAACVSAADCGEGKSCDATTGTCSDDKDTDGDGLLDSFEDKIGTKKDDADSDDDGVIDGQEQDPGGDVDDDKIINALDNDADNDGLQDGTETGSDCSAVGTDKAKCIPDADGGATKTAPGNKDTDGGGVTDGDEDTDKNGRVDKGERDPLNAADDKTNGTGGAGGASGAGGNGQGANGQGANGQGANGQGANGQGANGQGANGGNGQGANGGTGGAAGQGANGSGANGQGANGQGANGQGANGQGANGSGANGSGANGSGANGQGANGQGANGSGANGSGANGSGANGSGANGSGANGSGANGSGANGQGANAGSGANGAGANGAGANSGVNGADASFGTELEGGCSTTSTSSGSTPASTGLFAGVLGLLVARLRRRPRG